DVLMTSNVRSINYIPCNSKQQTLDILVAKALKLHLRGKKRTKRKSKKPMQVYKTVYLFAFFRCIQSSYLSSLKTAIIYSNLLTILRSRLCLKIICQTMLKMTR